MLHLLLKIEVTMKMSVPGIISTGTVGVPPPLMKIVVILKNMAYVKNQKLVKPQVGCFDAYSIPQKYYLIFRM